MTKKHNNFFKVILLISVFFIFIQNAQAMYSRHDDICTEAEVSRFMVLIANKEVITNNDIKRFAAYLALDDMDINMMFNRDFSLSGGYFYTPAKKGEKGNNALHFAAMRGTRGHELIIAMLLGCRANKDLINEDGKTAVQVARECGHNRIAEMIESFI